MRDQLDDASGGVTEVAGEGVPEGEVEDELARPRPRKQLEALTGPVEGRVEAVARDEKGKVVERPALTLDELDPRRPERGVEIVQRRQQLGRRAETRAQNLHEREAIALRRLSSRLPSRCTPRSRSAGCAASRGRVA